MLKMLSRNMPTSWQAFQWVRRKVVPLSDSDSTFAEGPWVPSTSSPTFEKEPRQNHGRRYGNQIIIPVLHAHIFNVPCTVEPSKFGPAKQAVEYVPHLVEESHNIVVTHECWFVGRGLGQIGNHSCQWVAAFSVGQFTTGENGPNSSMRIFAG